jgi:peptidoglycan-associated lipoprotein
MNLSKKLCLVLTSALVVFAGCLKKPQRPTPDQTVVGPAGNGLNAGDAGNLGLTDGSASGLTQRDPNVIEDEFKIKGLLSDVLFDLDKYNIKESERAKLQAAKEYLEKNPTYRLQLEGHADWRGTADYNLGLGDRRANAAKSYLSKLGVAAAKLESNSKGSLEAKEKGTEEEMAKDRCVKIIILKK